MSQELVFAENVNGQWFYILEDRGAPKDAWDWMEYAECFGPFDNLPEAQEHEYRSDSDTSGAEIIEYSDKRGLGETGKKLIEEALAKSAAFRGP